MRLVSIRKPDDQEAHLTGYGEALTRLACAFIKAGRDPIEAARAAHICLDELFITDADVARLKAEASEAGAKE